MALRFFDGCGEYYGTNEITRVWTSRANATVEVGVGRRGGNAIKCTAQTWHIWKGFLNESSSATAIFGFAIKVNGTLPSDTNFAIFYGGGFNHCSFFIRANGSVGLDQSFAEIAVSDPGIVSAEIWHYVEVKLTVDQTAGAVTIRVDGIEVASASGVDTRHASSSINTLDTLVLTSSASQTCHFDDVYICDDSGGLRDDFLGDAQVDVLLPDGDGTTSGFDTTFPASPTTHYTKVDEATPNDDTDYNETPTVNDVDLFDFEALVPLSGGGNVLGVKVAIMARKLTAGACNIRAVTRPVATNRNGASVPVQTDYDYKQEHWAQNPEISDDWTDATIDAAEFGVEKL